MFLLLVVNHSGVSCSCSCSASLILGRIHVPASISFTHSGGGCMFLLLSASIILGGLHVSASVGIRKVFLCVHTEFCDGRLARSWAFYSELTMQQGRDLCFCHSMDLFSRHNVLLSNALCVFQPTCVLFGGQGRQRTCEAQKTPEEASGLNLSFWGGIKACPPFPITVNIYFPFSTKLPNPKLMQS